MLPWTSTTRGPLPPRSTSSSTALAVRPHELLVRQRARVPAHRVALGVDEHAVLPAGVDPRDADPEEAVAEARRVRPVQPLLDLVVGMGVDVGLRAVAGLP